MVAVGSKNMGDDYKSAIVVEEKADGKVSISGAMDNKLHSSHRWDIPHSINIL